MLAPSLYSKKNNHFKNSGVLWMHISVVMTSLAQSLNVTFVNMKKRQHLRFDQESK